MAILSFHNERDTSRQSSVVSTTGAATTSTTSTTRDETMQTKGLWIQLNRLLHCMEASETSLSPSTASMSTTTTTTTTANMGASTSTRDQPSWQSLLMRAQMCQELYQQFLQETSTFPSNLSALATTSLAQRVDRACRRSQEMAEVLRIQEQEEQQQPDLIDQIFFAPTVSQDVDLQETTPDLVEEPAASVSLEPLEDNAPQDYDNTHTPNRRSDPRTEETSTEELQQLQREQMEDAIGIMAAQMKEATQQIQTQLQRQNKDTLSQLETVTEQTAEDVTQLTQKVQDHNAQRGWFSSSSGSAMSMWKLWLMIAIVFFLSVALIGTIPKRSNTCFLACRKTDTSLFGWFILPPLRMVLGNDILQLPSWSIYSLLGFDASDANKVPPDSINNDSSYWDHLYEDDDEERMEKEKLEKLMNSFQQPEEQEDSPPKADVRQIDWRLAMEEEDDAEGFDPFDAYDPVEKGGKNKKNKDAMEADPFAAFQPVKRGDKKEQDKPDPFDAFQPVDRAHKKEEVDIKEDAGTDPFSAFKPVERGASKEEASRDPFDSVKPVQAEKKEKKEGTDSDPFSAFKSVDRDTKKAKARVDKQHNEKNPTNDHDSRENESSKKDAGVIHDKTNVEPEVEEPKIAVEDVNLDDILASLHNAEKHSQEDIEAEMASEEKKVYDPHSVDDVSGDISDEDDGFLSRQGVAKMRISPRDVRAAADMGQADKLESYLQLQPSFMDRVDRNHWSALHLAARGGHVKVVQMLVERFGCDTGLRTNSDQTALDIAIARHGENHPVTRVLQRAVHGEEAVEAVQEETLKPRDEPKTEPNRKPKESFTTRPSRLELKKQALLRALASDDDFDNLEAYMEEGRKKLDDLHVVKPTKQLSTNDDESESMDSYIEAGRNRLEAILGNGESMKEEL